MTPLRRLLLGLLLLVATTACSEPDRHYAGEAAYDSLRTAPPDTVAEDRVDSLFLAYRAPRVVFERPGEAGVRAWVDSVLAGLTLREKVGQLFIVNLRGRGLQRLTGGPRDAVDEHGVGGFLLSRTMHPRDVFETTQALQRRSPIPLFFAADYERGVGRFSNPFTELPSNMAVGATRDTLYAAASARLTALESRAVGVNLLLAPVVDVNDNPDNPIINIRAYGGEPELVGRMARAYVREAERLGVLTTLKHFPGHGNTAVDTHTDMGVIEGDRAALEQVELRPYRMILGGPAGPAAVMSAHLWAKAFDEVPLPATFSRKVLTGLLRDDLGFDGLVLTDDVKMGALQNHYAMDERVVRPLQAGANVILTPASLSRAVDAVVAAVREGRLEEAEVDRSVRRVLTAKARAGLHLERLADPALLDSLLREPYGQFVAQTIADRSITLLRASSVLPLDSAGLRVALVHLTNYEGSESIDAAMDHFTEVLGVEEYVTDVRLVGAPTAARASRLLSDVEEADVVVLALYLRLRAGRGEAGLVQGQHWLVERLLAGDTPVVLVTFGNPYVAGPYADADAILVGYDQTLATVQAAARVLRGEQSPRGRLPVTVGPFAYGSGL